jgi:hypothetical protein
MRESASAHLRTYVVVDLGYPVLGRRGYRGLGTVTAPDREGARALVKALGFARLSDGPLGLMTPRRAGPRLLAEALANDGV